MGASADRIRKSHHERVCVQEHLEAMGPIPPEFLFSEDYRKTHKKRMDELRDMMGRACDNIVPDTQVLLVALSEACGGSAKIADGYLELAAARVQASGFGTTVEQPVENFAPRQLNVVEAINEAVAAKEDKATDVKAPETTTPRPGRRRPIAQATE